MMNEKTETVAIVNKLDKSANRGSGGPGLRLRKAREASGLSLEEIARKLCLTTTVVKRIETDDYQMDQSVTFLRGYLRSYANLVALDPEPLITEFNGLGLMDPPPVMSTQRIYHRNHSIISKTIPWIGAIVAICILALVIMWVHSEFAGNTNSLAPMISNVAGTAATTTSTNTSSTQISKPAVTQATNNNSFTSSGMDTTALNSNNINQNTNVTVPIDSIDNPTSSSNILAATPNETMSSANDTASTTKSNSHATKNKTANNTNVTAKTKQKTVSPF